MLKPGNWKGRESTTEDRMFRRSQLISPIFLRHFGLTGKKRSAWVSLLFRARLAVRLMAHQGCLGNGHHESAGKYFAAAKQRPMRAGSDLLRRPERPWSLVALCSLLSCTEEFQGSERGGQDGAKRGRERVALGGE